MIFLIRKITKLVFQIVIVLFIVFCGHGHVPYVHGGTGLELNIETGTVTKLSVTDQLQLAADQNLERKGEKN